MVGEDLEKGRLAVQWFLVDQNGSKHPAAQGTLKRSAAGNTSYQYRPIGVGLTHDFPDKVCALCLDTQQLHRSSQQLYSNATMFGGPAVCDAVRV